ncbi:hypothetical protein L873DRAFT_1792526 [Choiromyces venosus 120613-1]|uniref:Uncharacterized protein n=1 Tax=Choiromyces venosus 120613-1 TaxID=1336337 RepID=A0A3N4J9U8_9PEZI|nr:hypothetical protein L873DRAFT_1792526 [Choiromyces venosus 120613-1]
MVQMLVEYNMKIDKEVQESAFNAHHLHEELNEEEKSKKRAEEKAEEEVEEEAEEGIEEVEVSEKKEEKGKVKASTPQGLSRTMAKEEKVGNNTGYTRSTTGHPGGTLSPEIPVSTSKALEATKLHFCILEDHMENIEGVLEEVKGNTMEILKILQQK